MALDCDEIIEAANKYLAKLHEEQRQRQIDATPYMRSGLSIKSSKSCPKLPHFRTLQQKLSIKMEKHDLYS